MHSRLGGGFTFSIFAVIAASVAVLCFFALPETKGRTLAEVVEVMQRRGAAGKGGGGGGGGGGGEADDEGRGSDGACFQRRAPSSSRERRESGGHRGCPFCAGRGTRASVEENFEEGERHCKVQKTFLVVSLFSLFFFFLLFFPVLSLLLPVSRSFFRLDMAAPEQLTLGT